MEKNFLKQPSLDEVAEEAAVSPFHFQRLFSEWAGISPKRFLQVLTVDFLKSKLKESSSILQLTHDYGLTSQARVYDLFTTLEAVTPQTYKQQGYGMQIDYGFHETTFGLALIGVSERGVCWLSFVSDADARQKHILDMQQHWFNAQAREHPERTEAIVKRIFSSTNTISSNKLHLMVKGTNFQVKVWQALLQIPQGSVTTYQQVAQSIQQPKALQAVGSAVGANHIAYLIPCHRVIRKDGILGEYRWDSTRKKSMIGFEMATTNFQSSTDK